MKRILVVDDERQITRVLRMALQNAGYMVDTATDGLEGFRKFEEQPPDLVVVDLAMPEMNGLELTRAIRRISTVPIVVLSVRDAESMKVSALDDGADDYLTKPFSMSELQARLRAHLRRRTAEAEEDLSETLRNGDIEMNVAAHTVTVAGTDLHLTPKEFDLLRVLLRHAGKVMTHAALLRAVWGPAGESQPEYLRVLVGQLRKKLDRPPERRYIQTEPWIGYRLDAQGGAGLE